MQMNTATLNGLKFSYVEKITEHIDEDEYFDIYCKVTILESNNSRFNAGDQVDQISVSHKIHFEHEDGTSY